MTKVSPRLIALEVDGVDRSDEISKAIITSAAGASDFLTFAAARAGGNRDYMLNMTIAQDHASGTLWDLIFTGAGTEVDGTYAPYGNEDPSPTQPHYDFTATVAEPDGNFLGGEASISTTAVASIEVSWQLAVKPVPDTGV
jgi:hypothetical protein